MAHSIFTRIINKELPSWPVYEDERTLAILDIYPINHGHVLVLPKEPYTNVHDIPEDLFAHLMKVTKRLSDAVKTAVNADGINIIMNNGSAAGQRITDHAHIHIVPRFTGDGRENWAPGKLYEEGEKEKVATDIIAALTNPNAPKPPAPDAPPVSPIQQA